MSIACLKAMMVLSAFMSTSSAFADSTKVTQYIYSMNQSVQRTAMNKLDVIRDACVIRDVDYLLSNSRELAITVEKCSLQGRVIFLKFRTFNSARIFKDLLTNGQESLVILFDHQDDDSMQPGASSWINIKADVVYVWSDKNESVMKIGELIGPLRSVEEQSYYDQLMVYLFGRSYLNKVNFIEFKNKQVPTKSL